MAFLKGQTVNEVKECLPQLCSIKEVEQRLTNAFTQLFSEIKSGDIILAFEGNECKGIAQIPKDFIYIYDDNGYEYAHCLFPVEWRDWKELISSSYSHQELFTPEFFITFIDYIPADEFKDSGLWQALVESKEKELKKQIILE